MEEIKPETRARIIIKLGKAINYELASNVTEALVYEFVKILDPKNKILTNKHYLKVEEFQE